MKSHEEDVEMLKKVLGIENTILFVGSGISTWSNLPTWEGMMSKLAEVCKGGGRESHLVEDEISHGNLLQAASYGFDELTLDEKSKFMKNMYRHQGVLPHKIHEKLVSLGPSCFITTNYDDLIEQALRQKNKKNIKPCLNRDLTEMAGIIHADAKDFVFKPHGDAGDIESIVMTRRDYRDLMPHGKFHAAMETLRILLMTRPVIYVGFGFRDPDFSYVRDILGNLYQGATPNHYAIMADVPAHVKKFWREHDGIHIISYKTTNATKGGAHRHSNLLKLFEKLKT